MSDPVRLAIDDGVATITLARPDKLNALDGEMIAALGAIADRLDADPSVRAAILTGEGKGFCAGGDIKAWGGLSALAMGQDWVPHPTRDGETGFCACSPTTPSTPRNPVPL